MAIAYERSGKNELAERQFADALKSSKPQSQTSAFNMLVFFDGSGDNAHAENVLTEIGGP